ncbi:hypothetical protein [Abyssisolibacter fermentans]|uniref:hypothetical protein n=1 Tax=Abyssisolibacter fermentans TaxID=1766203 RepID=UPI0008297B2E|nr:hypothetical protein [Abyssisolibacter fermentans]
MNRKFEEILADAEKVEAIKNDTAIADEDKSLVEKVGGVYNDLYTHITRRTKIPNYFFGKAINLNLVKNKSAQSFAKKLGNAAEKSMKFVGNILNKDFNKDANWLNKSINYKLQEHYDVISNKGKGKLARLRKGTDSSIFKMIKKSKDLIKNKANSLKGFAAKPFKWFGSKMFANKGLINKIAKSPIAKKAGNLLKPLKNFGKKSLANFSKAFSPLGLAANLYTLKYDDSIFKKALAGIDIVGDFIPGVSQITSTLNFAGSLAYDMIKSTDIGKAVINKANNGLKFVGGEVVKGYKFLENKSQEIVKSTTTSLKKAGSFLSKTFNKTVDGIKRMGKSISPVIGYRNNKKLSFPNIKRINPNLNHPSNFIQSEIKNGTIDLYNNLYNNRSFNIKPNYKNQGTSNHNSNKNNFTINISGSSLSVDEIANQLASRIQTTMENVYA